MTEDLNPPARRMSDLAERGTIRRDDSEAPPSRHPTGRLAGHAATIFFVIGSCFIVLGGLVAAVTGPLGLSHGSWLAAYLVLVCGAAQCAMGPAQQYLAVHPIPARTSWIQLICWNLGNAAVIAGTLTAVPVVVDIGGGLVTIPLILTVRAVRNSSRRLLCRAYSAAMGILIISIPVGLTLAHLRHG